MIICEFCGTALPEQASFCGQCGQVPKHVIDTYSPTSNGFPSLAESPLDPSATVISASRPDFPPAASINQRQSNPSFPGYQNQGPPSFPGYQNQGPPSFPGYQGPPSFPGDQSQTLPAPTAEEEEEEKRRRAALLGLGIMGGFAGMAQVGNVPMVQGTPQMSGVPTVQGVPSTGSAPMPHSFPGNAGNPFASSGAPFASSGVPSSFPPIEAPLNPSYPTTPTVPATPTLPTTPTHPTNPQPPQPHPNPSTGCAPVWLILVTVFILIITSVITVAFTFLAPALSLNGSSDVPAGSSLHLYGSHFIPGSSVTLTLDGSIPLSVPSVYSGSSPLVTSNTQAAVGEVWTLAGQIERISSAGNTIAVSGDGSFNVAIAIGANWKIGQHTIRATESHSPRNAELTFNVIAPGTTPTPTLTPSLSPTPSDTATATATTTATVTPTPSPSATATSVPTGLSCINPGTVTLGPVSEGYNQSVSSVVTLCTSGSSVVNWTASWNQNAASWLKLNHTSGQIQAPAQQQITVSASGNGLKTGNYSTTVTFNDQKDNSSETLTVNLTVQAGCVTAVPTSLSFTGEASVSDPSAQTVSVTNCGSLPATWSASVNTGTSGNWLSVSSASGTLNSKTAQNITVTASNLNAKLSAGNYSGSITFAIGSTQSTVQVTLTVQAAPTLVVVVPNPPTFNADSSCSYSSTSGTWTCVASISNSSSSQSLNWTSSSSGIAGITFKPASGTLSPSQGTRVIISVPANNCQVEATLTFSGPANSDNITWYCTIIG